MSETAVKNIEGKRITIVEDFVVVARAIAELSLKAGHKTQVIFAGLTERDCDPSKPEAFSGLGPLNVVLRENEVRAQNEETILAAINDFRTEILLLDHDLPDTRTSGRKIAQKLGEGIIIVNISSDRQPYSSMQLGSKEHLVGEDAERITKISAHYEKFFASLK